MDRLAPSPSSDGRLSRRAALRFGAGGLALVASGRTRLGSAATPAPDATPAATPGRVDIGGRALFLDSRGAGRPTVVLEAGYGNGTGAWNLVQPALAQLTRVCSYDRAGLGQSDPSPRRPRAGAEVVADLRALLTAAGEPGPYVLVGHSLGGLYARLFAGLHPADVAGLVLVDATPPDFFPSAKAALPAPVWQAVQQFLAASPEAADVDLLAVSAEAMAAPALPEMPLIVLADGGPFPPASQLPPGFPLTQLVQLWRDGQRALAGLAPGGRLVEALRSGHDIPHDRPELVMAAVTEVVAAVRSPGSWATPMASPAAAATPAA